jgi:Xylanase inhibitor C-terminal
LIEADGFTFENGHIENVPYMYVPGSGLQKPTGFLSLSRSSYSLQRTAQAEAFSYRFSDQDSNSYLTLGGGTSPIATTLQSTKILTNPSHRNLYYVNLTQISIGNNSYKIDPSTNSASMILDTVIGPTLLETAVYAQVKTELNKVRKNKKFTDKVNRLEICYKIKSRIFRYKRPRWPDLTLYFPSDPSNSSAGAEMVLTKMNYVVTVKKGRTKAECASIFETKGASVIGMMAQINREMVFDFSSSEPRLYFSQYP